MLVDSHAHLDFPEIASQLPDVLDRAREAGVDRILTIGCVGKDPDLISKIVGLTQTHREIYAALGVHPHDARHFTEEIANEIQGAMSHPKVLGWGEIGLDFHYDFSEGESQRRAFRRQLEMAQECNKPVIIHSRQAGDETCRMLQDTLQRGPLRGVMHCFTYGAAEARRFLGLGFLLGFGGILTFPRSEELREVARQVPSDRFLIETDSPYLAPVPHRGKVNEPALVTHVVQTLASLRNQSEAEIGLQATTNFENLFSPISP